MKIQIAVIAVALLAGCAQQESNSDEAAVAAQPSAAAADAVPAQPSSVAADMNMTPDAHQAMAEDAATMGMSAEAHAAMSGAGASTDKTANKEAGAMADAKGMGVVKDIDAAGGKVTIAHDPIASLNWPAMTMAFNASPELLSKVKEGEKVHFEFSQHEGTSTLSVIETRK